MGKLIDADAAIDFVGSMNMCDEISNEAYKKLTSYLDELPSAEPYTTTHDSIPAETGKNDGDGTSGDCISRQAVTKFLNDWLSCLFENCHKQSASDLKMIIKDFKNLPSAQPEQHLDEWCVDCKEYDKEKHSCPRWNRVIRQTLLDAQPERKTGHWIAITSRNNTYKCSVCGRLLTNITDGKNKVAKNYPYCHCGADMRGGENDGCSQVLDSYCGLNEEGKTAFRMAIEALNCSEFPNSSDTISRQAAIAHAVPLNLFGREVMMVSVSELENLPSAQPEPLTDKEQRIFLAAMGREEKVCKHKDSLVRVCHEIERKVKGALWT